MGQVCCNCREPKLLESQAPAAEGRSHQDIGQQFAGVVPVVGLTDARRHGSRGWRRDGEQSFHKAFLVATFLSFSNARQTGPPWNAFLDTLSHEFPDTNAWHCDSLPPNADVDNPQTVEPLLAGAERLVFARETGRLATIGESSFATFLARG